MGERYYTQSHEWVLVEGDTATVGITDFAQSQLGDVVFVELPDPGKMVEAGDNFGVIESVKAASDLYCPVSGSVIEANDTLGDNPELVNADPMGRGWLIKVRMNGDPGPGLLDEMGYAALVGGSL
ncbi:MAG TPA: glycine cleavage system protein GcvH [Candidatus Acidoferrales bacterium]|nr:glycine cleavage system protein GcvH [Candidatus Acidoferrales bacterium]